MNLFPCQWASQCVWCVPLLLSHLIKWNYKGEDKWCHLKRNRRIQINSSSRRTVGLRWYGAWNFCSCQLRIQKKIQVRIHLECAPMVKQKFTRTFELCCSIQSINFLIRDSFVCFDCWNISYHGCMWTDRTYCRTTQSPKWILHSKKNKWLSISLITPSTHTFQFTF